MKNADFEYETLDVWNVAIDFADSLIELSERLREEYKCYRLVDQLQSASTSISMNIAEGQGRKSPKSFILFLSYSKGSLYEVLTLAEILFRRRWLEEHERNTIRMTGLRIVKMINALISSLKRKQQAV